MNLWNRFISRIRRRRGSSLRILCLLGDGRDRRTIESAARKHRWELHFALDRADAEALLGRLETAVVFVDRDVAGEGWRELLNAFALRNPNASIILASRRIDESLWNEVVHSGGYEAIAMPLTEVDIARAVKMAQNWAATVRK